MTEADFIEQIDCRFPYGSPLKRKRVLAVAPRISTNSAFMVIHELCRPPISAKVSATDRYEIYLAFIKRFRHPLLTKLKPIIVAMIYGELISVSKAIKAMYHVEKYQNQFNALAICYFACDDRHGRANEVFERILEKWRNA